MHMVKFWQYDAENNYVKEFTENTAKGLSRSFEIRMSNLLLILTQAEYKIFFDHVQNWYEHRTVLPDDFHIISTGCNGIDIVLYKDQMERLFRLLDRADTAMKTEHLVAYLQ